jgi:hypothetical protein
MNFTRGGDIKETLKIGRKANALKLSHFDVKGKLAIPVNKKSLTNKIIAKYHFNEDTSAIVVPVNFALSEMALIHALEILAQNGICKRFHEYIEYLMIKRAPDEIKKYPDIPFCLDKGIKTKLKWVLLNTGHLLSTIQLTFKTTGMDLLYHNQLYRIAPPKDGGLEDE